MAGDEDGYLPAFGSSSSKDTTPIVKGMKVFGIRKGNIHRAIVKFREQPEKQPQTVCFHFPGTFMTHRYVLDMVRSRLTALDGERVRTIQFVNRNTIHGTQDLDNRWLVKLHSEKAAAHLVNYGIDLYNRHIFVRYYDDVLTEEYDEYLNYLEYQKQLQMVTKGQNDERGTWLGQVW